MITVDASGLLALKERITNIQAKVKPTLVDAVQNGAVKAEQRFSVAAPVGKTEGTTIPGDASGKLKDSFSYRLFVVTNGAGVSIYTRQPLKLKYVRFGTGLYGPLGHRIYPVHARALYWEGAAHPYRSIAGMKPNDFITPTQPKAKQDIRDSVVSAMSSLLGSL